MPGDNIGISKYVTLNEKTHHTSLLKMLYLNAELVLIFVNPVHRRKEEHEASCIMGDLMAESGTFKIKHPFQIL